MPRRGPGFAVLYRWRLHPGAEDSFVAAWSRISALLLTEKGSLGSRLYRGADGIWYSYAQWPSAEARERAFAAGSLDPVASAQMRAAIAESFPEVVLESGSRRRILWWRWMASRAEAAVAPDVLPTARHAPRDIA